MDQGIKRLLLLIQDVRRKISGGVGFLIQKDLVLPYIQRDVLQVIVLPDPQRYVSPSCPISVSGLSRDTLILSKMKE